MQAEASQVTRGVMNGQAVPIMHATAQDLLASTLHFPRCTRVCAHAHVRTRTHTYACVRTTHCTLYAGIRRQIVGWQSTLSPGDPLGDYAAASAAMLHYACIPSACSFLVRDLPLLLDAGT
jgi:hypothetical protein